MQARLDDVQRRLNEHPGYREHVAGEELARTVNAVLVRNLDELLALLAQPTWDQALAVELFQNMYRPDAREAYEAAVTQRLHNYVAGAATLVDHARRLMKGRTGTIPEEFERRKADVIANPEVPFIKDLRNFVLHQAHPFLGHTVRILDPDGPATGEIELSATNLLGWSGWKAPARAFIKSQPESFALRPIALQHGQLMVRLHNWLHNELAEANAADLEDANRLVVERNAILGGMDPEAAKRLTEAITKLRESPTPIKTDDLPDALGSQSLPSSSSGK
ncbi:MAG: hypothetical protein WA484_12430 [Solirubrobacteraceae bacterium]